MDNQQETIFKLQMFEQQIQHLQQQIHAIEQGIVDLEQINTGIDELIGAKEKEVLSPIGKGIFVKTRLISENLIVDVGGKNFVTKSIPETKQIINEQIEKLNEIKIELQANIEKGSMEFQNLLIEAQEQFKKQDDRLHEKECACAQGKKCKNHEKL